MKRGHQVCIATYDLTENGPLAILPLNQKDNNQGLLLLGHPTQKDQWHGDAFEVPVVAAQLIATAIARARQTRKQDYKASIINGQIPDQQTLEQIKIKTRETVQALKTKISDLNSEIQNQDATNPAT